MSVRFRLPAPYKYYMPIVGKSSLNNPNSVRTSRSPSPVTPAFPEKQYVGSTALNGEKNTRLTEIDTTPEQRVSPSRPLLRKKARYVNEAIGLGKTLGIIPGDRELMQTLKHVNATISDINRQLGINAPNIGPISPEVERATTIRFNQSVRVVPSREEIRADQQADFDDQLRRAAEELRELRMDVLETIAEDTIMGEMQDDPMFRESTV